MKSWFTGKSVQIEHATEPSYDITLDVSDQITLTDEPYSFAPFVTVGKKLTYDGVFGKVYKITASDANQAYVNLSGFTVTETSKTFLVWIRPTWDSASKPSRICDVFGFTNSSDVGLFLRVDNSGTYEWEITDGTSTSVITTEAIHPHDADDLLFFAVTIDSGEGATGYSYIGTPGVYREEVLTDVPVSWWRLSDGDSTAVDQMENNDGTYDAGTQQQESLISTDDDFSLYTDGSGGVTVPYDASINPTELSIEFWLKCDNPGVEEILIDCLTAGNDGFRITKETDNSITFTFGEGTGTVSVSSDVLDVTETHHIVCVFDTSDSYIYVDGVEANSNTGTFSPNTTDDLTIGTELVGFIDDVSIYDFTLSLPRILAHYDAGRGSVLRSCPPINLVTFTPARLHIGGKAAAEYLDGYVEKIIVLDEVLTEDEIEGWAQNGYSFPTKWEILIDFNYLAGMIIGPNISTPIEGDDSITMSEETPNVIRLAWQKLVGN